VDLQPDNILNDRYKIKKQLGKGGMGAVYLAEDLSLEQQVAVKVNQNPQEESTSQFLREARLLAALKHPHLPRVIDYFINGTSQYLVMDYIPGKDLGELLEKEGAQPVELVLKWAQELGSALTYLHQQTPPVIHRDIKPGNIKLGANGAAILVDFGIAKAADNSQVTAAGAWGYTPGFAPPEQYGSARTGPYSDQYSLAATLYNLLTGQRPAESVKRVLENATLASIRLLNPAVPAHTASSIERALSVRPENRFIDINEFIQALTNPSFKAAKPVPTVKPATKPLQKKSNRIWLILGGLFVGSVILVFAGLGAAGYYFWNREKAARQNQTEVLTISQQTPSPQGNISSNAPKGATSAAPVILTQELTVISTVVPTNTFVPTSIPPTATSRPLGKGGLLAFASDRGDGKTLQIWTMKVSLDNSGKPVASNITQLTFSEGDKKQPAWSPDGTRLLFTAPGTKKDSLQKPDLDIWVTNSDGSNALDLSLKKGDDFDPVWSPDGSKIAFTNNGRDDGVRQVFMMNSDGTDLHRISYDFEEFSPTWSPGMDWLAFVISANSSNILYLRNSDKEYATPVPFDTAEVMGRLGQVADPTWSWDGKQIAYTRQKGLQRDIFSVIFSSRGQKVARLTTTNFEEEACWSPDDQWIAFTSSRDKNKEVYLMTSTGLLQTNVSQSPGSDMQPAWQPIP
jgi:eukaryotic-like serine/threonine-protein kinase